MGPIYTLFVKQTFDECKTNLTYYIVRYMIVHCGHIVPICDLHMSNMCVNFYLKSICGELFFSNRTIINFGFFSFIEDEKLVKNTCSIYLHFPHL